MLKSYEKFTEIISSENISTYRVSKETGVSLPIFTSWKNGIKNKRRFLRLRCFI